MSLIIDEHQQYLADQSRLAAFQGGGVVSVVRPVRTLTEIEDEVFRLHSDVFRNREAAVLAAEVVTRYSE